MFVTGVKYGTSGAAKRRHSMKSFLTLILAAAFTVAWMGHAGEAEKARRREHEKDNDEKVDRRELRSAVDSELKALDTDKDGKIDHGERKALRALRDKLDKDGDGIPDREEMKKLREKHPELHERLVKRMRENHPNAARTPESREQHRESYVDKREGNQQRRIDHGIQKGYLTGEETQKLQNMEKQIADTEASYKSDGKLSKDETKQLRDMLDQASVQIWSEKHDTEGNQMPTYRYGKNVFAKDSFTSQIENSNMSGSDARALMKEFHEASAAKRRLANDNLSIQERADLQAKYNDFLNKYFEVH
jgi:hypothetical protein